MKIAGLDFERHSGEATTLRHYRALVPNRSWHLNLFFPSGPRAKSLEHIGQSTTCRDDGDDEAGRSIPYKWEGDPQGDEEIALWVRSRLDHWKTVHP